MLVTKLYKTVKIEDVQQLAGEPIYIDLRSPIEYKKGHILNAINIPIFDNEERAEIGYVYKNNGVEVAKDLGLAIASKKLPSIVSEIRKLNNSKRAIIVYCWRGGMRSKSIVTILDLMGVQAFQLVGGYKQYRNLILEKLQTFSLHSQIILLCGSTGVGKTKVLNLLAERNIPIIDLEQLANHRGSVFGQIGLGDSETAQNFDSKLLAYLEIYRNSPYIVLECESKRIGNVYLPEFLYQAMKAGKKILLEADFQIRISRLIEEYTDIYKQNNVALLNSLSCLTKQLGHKKIASLIDDFNKGNVHNVVKILLSDYYDPLYGYERANNKQFDLAVCCNNLDDASDKIIAFLHELENK